MTKSNAHPEMDCILWILCNLFFLSKQNKIKILKHWDEWILWGHRRVVVSAKVIGDAVTAPTVGGDISSIRISDLDPRGHVLEAWSLQAHACNPSYLGGRLKSGDHSLRPAWANSSRPHFHKNNQSKMNWRCGSSGRGLLCKCKALSSNSSPIKKEVELNLQ
jgi:hypothetical protein